MLTGLMQDDFQLTLQHVLRRMRSFPEGGGIVTLSDDGPLRASFAEVAPRIDRLARVLGELGVKRGECVASFAWNSQRHFECYLAVPCIGAVLHTVNVRLFSEQIIYVLNHAEDRVVFVDETGPKEKRRKRLAIMDMDGANVKVLGSGEELVVTPQFSPSAQQVAYMSFGAGDPKVTLLNLETGQRESVGNFPGMTFAPRFSPDGQQIVMSLSEGASTNLYTMDLRSRATTRLTENSAIDTSPTYSPDGARIVTASADNTARIWDARSGKQLAVLSGHGDGIFCAGFSPDGMRSVA